MHSMLPETHFHLQEWTTRNPGFSEEAGKQSIGTMSLLLLPDWISDYKKVISYKKISSVKGDLKGKYGKSSYPRANRARTRDKEDDEIRKNG